MRDAKKYGCPPCIYQIRSKLLVLPATGNSHWSNPDAICHQMSITPHQKICIGFTGKPHGKMNDVDLDGLASDLGFVLKVEQKEDVESLLRGKDVFGVLPTDFRKKPDISAVCFGEKQSFQLAKCFSRTINKTDRQNTTPTCSSCHLYICRLFFGLSTFLSLHSL